MRSAGAGRSTAPGHRAISRQLAADVLTSVAVIALLIELLPGAGPVSATIRLLIATFAISVVPGAAAMLLVRPRPWQRLHLLLVMAIGLSLVASQVGVFAALLLHLPASIISKVILGASILMAVAARSRRDSVGGVIVDRDEGIVVAVLAVYGAILFLRGSPVMSDEDQTHIGIIGRLAALPSPAIDNFYYAPGVIYTHPFPGISFLEALIARVSHLDAIFVYHKLRFFFGAAAVLMVYAGARRIFVSRRLSLVTLLAVTVLALTGRFADFGDYFWA